MAGLRAAIETSKYAEVALISKVHPLRSHSGAAQGGINAPLGNHPDGKDDTWEKHAFDTVKGSDFLADQDAVEIFTKEASLRIYEMEHWGVPFSRTEDGKIAQRPFGGAAFPRTCYAADKTGHTILHTLYEQVVKRRIKVYEEWQVTSLAVEGGICYGVVAMSRITGELSAFCSDVVLFATGGAGRTYSKSTNAIINTGSGMAIAYRAGVPLKDMEFIQFHPTSLVGTNLLMTEGCRGEGGYLVNAKGERFMKNYSPKYMELAPRDIVSRSIQTEINEGRGFENEYVHLDLRHLGRKKIMERLPGIRDICIHFIGIDPIESPIPIQPGQHYTMGGISCNERCETEVKGFYAAGEAACVSVHGANRLGGNSLLETVVFGKIAGAHAAKHAEGKEKDSRGKKVAEDVLRKEEERINNLITKSGKERPGDIRQELKKTMDEKAGIFREKKPMEEGLSKIKELKERYKDATLSYRGKKCNLDLARALELECKLDIAEVVTTGAINRQESRGSHCRLDFKDRDDTHWLKHTIARHSPQGPIISYEPVRITTFKPEARKY